MGGTNLTEGLTQSSVNPRACNRLRCLDCDKKVLMFGGKKWTSNVDYLFVRNYNTNPKELIKGLEPENGTTAYAC